MKKDLEKLKEQKIALDKKLMKVGSAHETDHKVR